MPSSPSARSPILRSSSCLRLAIELRTEPGALETRAVDLENAEVAGGLHQTRNVHAHRLDAVGVKPQEAADLLRVAQRQRLRSDGARCEGDGDVGVCSGVFLVERILQLGADFLRAGKLSVFQCNDGARGVRNGVILETALCRDKAYLQLVDQRLQHAPERDGCICTTLGRSPRRSDRP